MTEWKLYRFVSNLPKILHPANLHAILLDDLFLNANVNFFLEYFLYLFFRIFIPNMAFYWRSQATSTQTVDCCVHVIRMDMSGTLPRSCRVGSIFSILAFKSAKFMHISTRRRSHIFDVNYAARIGKERTNWWRQNVKLWRFARKRYIMVVTDVTDVGWYAVDLPAPMFGDIHARRGFGAAF